MTNIIKHVPTYKTILLKTQLWNLKKNKNLKTKLV